MNRQRYRELVLSRMQSREIDPLVSHVIQREQYFNGNGIAVVSKDDFIAMCLHAAWMCWEETDHVNWKSIYDFMVSNAGLYSFPMAGRYATTVLMNISKFSTTGDDPKALVELAQAVMDSRGLGNLNIVYTVLQSENGEDYRVHCDACAPRGDTINRLNRYGLLWCFETDINTEVLPLEMPGIHDTEIWWQIEGDVNHVLIYVSDQNEAYVGCCIGCSRWVHMLGYLRGSRCGTVDPSQVRAEIPFHPDELKLNGHCLGMERWMKTKKAK